MKKGTKFVLIIAPILVLLGVAVCIAAFTMGADPVRLFTDGTYSIRFKELDDIDDFLEGDRPGFGSNKDGHNAETQHITSADNNYILDTEINRIDIDWVSGNVKFVRAEGNRVSFSESAPGGVNAEERLICSVEGNTLKISCCDSGGIAIGININSGCNKELTVNIPDGMEDITVRTTSADVNIEKIAIADMFEVITTSGDIMANGMNCGSVKMDTTSGEIEYSGQCSGFNAESTSGNIVVSGVFRDFEADTTSGDVRVLFEELPHELSIETTSGPVDITVPESSSFELEYDTVSGKLNCDFPVKMHGEEYIVGSGGAEISVDTTSADLTVRSK